MGPPCANKCRSKCYDKLNYDNRKLIFDSYWELGDHTRQWDFIAQHVTVVHKKQQIANRSLTRRNFSREYNLTVDNIQFKVCKNMFLQTLSISETVVNTTLSKLKNSPTISKDMRGKHFSRPNVIADDVKNLIKEHISSFPAVESHYIRHDSKREYLESGLSISKMYRLYTEWIKDKPTNSSTINATLRQYNDIFNNDFNLSFFKPKKDLCDVCEQYKLSSDEEKIQIQTSYEEHIKNKTLARDIKNADKERAKTDPKLCVAVFDLQKVLTSPQSEVSSFYYKRKFATYNFTIYDLQKKQGYCFMWTETDANRGSNEISTCLLKFIKMMKESGYEEYSFFSDNCAGQNRNRFIYAMWEHAAFTLKIKIKHTFLEKGHTQNEGDSMHAVIENSKKHKIIYVPNQWITLVRCAKIYGNPYLVYELSYEDFLDFKPLVENSEFNWKTSTDKQIIKWNSVKQITVSYETPFTLNINYNLDRIFTITMSMLNIKKRGKFQPRCVPLPAYEQKLPLDKMKIKDLLSLCDKGLIPSCYHDFYRSLTPK